MLLGLVLLVVFAVVGWLRAARRGGTLADRAQYAAAHGVPGFLLGVILAIIAARMGF